MIPATTNKQFFVLFQLYENRRRSSEIRAEMRAHGWKIEHTKFATFMQKMVRRGHVASELRESRVNGKRCRELFYSLTDEGREAYTGQVKWYQSLGVV